MKESLLGEVFVQEGAFRGKPPRKEDSVKNHIDMLIFHTAICAAGVTKRLRNGD